MHVLRKLLAASAAAIVAVASGVLVAHADTTPTVYNTPGGQISGGRLWNTTCEMYSSNVVRCRAEIWATQVQYRGGRYVSVTGWTFNNLSYLPSPRASWAGNNLGLDNNRWTSGGRTWKTECDTASTGRGGCRSYVWTRQVRREGGGYVSQDAWVFNNLVLFSSPSVPAVTRIPSWIIDQSRLDFGGLGPLQRGVSMTDLGRLGYVRYRTEDACSYWQESASLTNRGVTVFWSEDDLHSVLVDKPGIRTVDGAHVGMTLGQVKAIYGDRLRLVTKDGYEPVYTAVVESGDSELVFFNSFQLDRPLIDSDVIKIIIARKVDTFLGWDGC